jgi:hypothetical protein
MAGQLEPDRLAPPSGVRSPCVRRTAPHVMRSQRVSGFAEAARVFPRNRETPVSTTSTAKGYAWGHGYTQNQANSSPRHGRTRRYPVLTEPYQKATTGGYKGLPRLSQPWAETRTYRTIRIVARAKVPDRLPDDGIRDWRAAHGSHRRSLPIQALGGAQRSLPRARRDARTRYRRGNSWLARRARHPVTGRHAEHRDHRPLGERCALGSPHSGRRL